MRATPLAVLYFEKLIVSTKTQDAERLKTRISEITGTNAVDTGADRPLIHVDSKVDGYCGICNVDR